MSIEKAVAWAQIIGGICAPIAVFFAAALFFGWTPHTFHGLDIVSAPVGLAAIILLLVVIPWAVIIATRYATPAGTLDVAEIQEVSVRQQGPTLIEGWKLTKLRQFLKDKPKGTVRVVGEEGSPVAYSDGQRLAQVFRESGWNVVTGSVGFHFSAGVIFVIDYPDQMSRHSPLIRESLAASGIAFQRFTMNDTAFTTSAIYITAPES